MWQFNDGARTCQNLAGHTSGAESMWALLHLLDQSCGWTLVDSYDGTSGYPSAVTGDGSGANGLDNVGAWMHMQEPGGGREILAIRGSSHYLWNVLYSVSAGFPASVAGAAPAAASDEVSLVSGWGAENPPGDAAQRTPTSTYTAIFPSSGSWTTSCAGQDTDVLGVYAFWLFTAASGTEETLFMCDARVVVGSGGALTGDNDPSLWYCADYPPLRTYLGSESYSTQSLYGYVLQGDSDEEWDGFTARYYSTTSGAKEPDNGVGPNPHNSAEPLVPLRLLRSSAGITGAGEAGRAYYMRWNPDNSSYAYTNIFQTGSLVYVLFSDIVLPGWFSAATDPA